MHVGAGYSERPDTASAGIEAAQAALAQAKRSRPCDMALLFATAQHDPRILRDAVVSILGTKTRIIGGSSVGAITNDHYGYAGNQVGLAAFWLEGVRCELAAEGGLLDGGFETGRRLGKRLEALGVKRRTPVMLFYDSINRTRGKVELIMASPILDGIENGLGFFPDLVGAGMTGDYASTPTNQWKEGEVVGHHALALVFKGDMRVDSVIMHGCRPATGYYTVTRADRETILEIDGRPALPFMRSILGDSVNPDEYAFFLILGVNRSDKWGRFSESLYANHLCLAIDRERDGIVMFEPDMAEGTSFQIMYRSLDLEYIRPRVNALFDNLGGRKPTFAFYIDCAGRAAGYAGIDSEDALAVQEAVAGRAPLLGIYSGVEIASVMDRPRALDWTGVFCLFSVPE